jgi:hypothetical protein
MGFAEESEDAEFTAKPQRTLSFRREIFSAVLR